jgi:hypothetical protein
MAMSAQGFTIYEVCGRLWKFRTTNVRYGLAVRTWFIQCR